MSEKEQEKTKSQETPKTTEKPKLQTTSPGYDVIYETFGKKLPPISTTKSKKE